MHKFPSPLLNNKNWLIEKYINEHNSVLDIARQIGCSPQTVCRYLGKHNVPTRKKTVFIDITGKKYRKLTVLKRVDSNRYGKSKWLCQCECGKTIITTQNNLHNKKTKSCSCFGRISRSKRSWKGYKEISSSFLTGIRHHAKRKKRIFNITLKEIWNLFLKQNRKCSLSGQELYFPDRLLYSSSEKRRLGTASLDRIDSKKGYTIDNVQWVHKNINMAKQNKSDFDFIQMCHTVSDYQRSKNK
jgi:hypothetical protein